VIAERSSSFRAGSGTKNVTLFRCCYLFCYAEAQGFLRHCGLRNNFQRYASRDVCTPDWKRRNLCYVVTFDEEPGKIQTKSGAWVGNRSRNNAGTGGYTSAFGERRGSVVSEREAMLIRPLRSRSGPCGGAPNLEIPQCRPPRKSAVRSPDRAGRVTGPSPGVPIAGISRRDCFRDSEDFSL
jgi:hypothetical protein